MRTDRVLAEYSIESPIDLRRAAELLASEQSIGSFGRVHGESDTVIEKFGARVESLELAESTDRPALATSLPGAHTVFQAGRAVISFPTENFGSDLSSLAVVLLGNLFELQELTRVRLEDIFLPHEFQQRFQRPGFGVAGTRRSINVTAGPVIGTIVKPKLGLPPEETASLVTALGEAGIHFIKDDECMTNPPHARLSRRITAVSAALDRIADRLGRRVMYAYNITDEPDQMRRNHDMVLESGGSCVMVSLNACGFSAVAGLRRYCQLPVHGHRAGWGMLTRHPGLGLSFRAYQKLWRLAGIDHLHIGGLQSKFWEDDASVAASGRSCLEPFGDFPPIMPVVSSAQWAGQAAKTYAEIGCDDLIYLAGGGILAHPGGPAAGVRAVKDAWEAARLGIPLEEFAVGRPELLASIATFGRLRVERGARG